MSRFIYGDVPVHTPRKDERLLFSGLRCTPRKDVILFVSEGDQTVDAFLEIRCAGFDFERRALGIFGPSVDRTMSSPGEEPLVHIRDRQDDDFVFPPLHHSVRRPEQLFCVCNATAFPVPYEQVVHASCDKGHVCRRLRRVLIKALVYNGQDGRLVSPGVVLELVFLPVVHGDAVLVV